MLVGKDFRIQLTTESHFWFFHCYFNSYVTYPTAEFQREIFALTESDKKMVVIVAFRGSAKSTICTMSYPIWAILGKQQKKFVVIVSQTQRQAQQHLMNLKHELERNVRLCNDLGPFREDNGTWGQSSLVFMRHNARIMAVSIEQPIRGMRHNQYRPDLVIADDIEDLESVKTKEGRDKTYNALEGDIIPAGSLGTKILVVGNLLHNDSVVMRLKKAVDEKKIDAVYRAYPLTTDDNQIAWRGKYSDAAAVEDERRKLSSSIAWEREFNLKIIPEEDQLIREEWIHYYDELPKSGLRYTITGIDLAIGQKDTNDYTAMVSAHVYRYNKDLRIYILPNPICERMDFPATLECAKTLSKMLGNGTPTKLVIEDVAYQKSIIQALQEEYYPAVGFNVVGQDKRMRLTLTTSRIQSGQILFPKQGAEGLIQNLVGFGIEKHDDLADAFAILILSIADEDMNGGHYVIPSSHNVKQKDSQDRATTEKAADSAVIIEQEYERGRFNGMMKNTIRRYKGFKGH